MDKNTSIKDFKASGQAFTPYLQMYENDKEFKSRVNRVSGLIADVIEGRKSNMELREAMTTSDFPVLTGTALELQLLEAYRMAEVEWNKFCGEKLVANLNTQRMAALTGGGTLPEVGENEDYSEGSVGEEYRDVKVTKYGKHLALTVEMIINDQLDEFAKLPRILAQDAQRTIIYNITKRMVSSSGLRATLYHDGNFGNIVSGNPALTTASLKTAVTQLRAKKDPNTGEPIAMNGQIKLVVPAELEITALEIVNALELFVETGVSGELARTANYFQRRIEVVVNPYLPMVNSTSGSTNWFLFADPRVNRPAIVATFLRGFREPELFIETPNAQYVGGGNAPALGGSFQRDSIRYKVRHWSGTGILSEISTVASAGTGNGET